MKSKYGKIIDSLFNYSDYVQIIGVLDKVKIKVTEGYSGVYQIINIHGENTIALEIVLGSTRTPKLYIYVNRYYTNLNIVSPLYNEILKEYCKKYDIPKLYNIPSIEDNKFKYNTSDNWHLIDVIFNIDDYLIENNISVDIPLKLKNIITEKLTIH